MAWDRVLGKRNVFHDKRDSAIIMNELYDELYKLVDYDDEDNTHALSAVAFNPAERTPKGMGYGELAALWAQKRIYDYGIQWETWISMTPGRRQELIEGLNRGVQQSAAAKAALKMEEDLRRQEEELRKQQTGG